VPYDDDDTEKRTPEQEGVRIIGAEEAAEALERDDVAHRISAGEPRFGDRPQSPESPGPRPTIRFPLPADSAPEPAGTAQPAPPPADMPHWTEPPTGEVPRIFAVEDLEGEGGGDTGWSAFTTGQPRWRGEGPDVHEEYDDFSRLADDETRVGALAGDDRPHPDDFFAFDDEPAHAEERWDEDVFEQTPAEVWDEEEAWEEEPEHAGGARTRAISSDPRRTGARRAVAGAYQRPAGAGRNVPVAVGVGVAFAALALLSFSLGAKYTVALVTVVLGVAAAELFNVLRQAGYQPATLLGLSATVALPLAAYYKGETGIPLALFLTVAAGLVWFLVGAGGHDRPVIGLSSTLFGVGWVGLLGSFAALMLVLPTTADGVGDPGLGVLLTAILGTVAYDVGGFAVGRNAGSRPLSAASPSKTVEGLLGGIAISAVATLTATSLIAPFDELDFLAKVLLAVAIALAAVLGDLCESLVKRDLDVKDMGSILPGHGGFLDRFDALLFVLPTVYYLARVLLY